MSIPPYIYLAIGVFVSLYSWFVSAQAGSNLTLFIIVGVVFFLFGILKMFNVGGLNLPGPTEVKKHVHPTPAAHNHHAKHHTTQHTHHNHKENKLDAWVRDQKDMRENQREAHIPPSFRSHRTSHNNFCKYCGDKRSHGNFCSNCGKRY